MNSQNFNIIKQHIIKNKYPISCGLMSATIFGINLANMKKSPIYDTSDPLCKYRIIATSSIKGFVYGMTFPFSTIFIALSIDSKEAFSHHFIPNSVYNSRY